MNNKEKIERWNKMDKKRTQGDWVLQKWAGPSFHDLEDGAYKGLHEQVFGDGVLGPVGCVEPYPDDWKGSPTKMSQVACVANGYDNQNFIAEAPRMLTLLNEQQAEIERLRGALEWLVLPHDIDTSTKQRSNYWVNQFKVACTKAKQALEKE